MLTIIHNDHANMGLLLALLRKKTPLLEENEKVDYRLIKTVVTYLKNYADQFHHPLEDLIYDYYIKHRLVSDEVAGRLSQEHKVIKKVTVELDALLDIILLDAIVAKEHFIKKLSEFIDLQTAHLAYEEQYILPEIAKSLSAEDWTNLALQWQDQEYIDPLFGDNVSEQYRALARSI